MPNIDPSNFNTQDRPQLGPGVHAARIVSSEMRDSKSGDSKYLNWKFETLNGGHWVFLRTGLYGKGLEMLKKVVHAAGRPDYEGGPINTDELNGSTVVLTLEDDPNSKYLQVIDVLPPEQIPF